MATQRYDAVIVGGGHNGLVCAAYLARAGRRVLVVERDEIVGGAARTQEVFPGFRFSVFSYVVSLLRPEIIRDLDLPRHGLHILPLESTITPLPNGDYLGQWGDHDQNRRELARHSLARRRGVRRVRPAHAPDGACGEAAARDDAAGSGVALAPRPRGACEARLVSSRASVPSASTRLQKLLTMSSADYLDEWFETEALKATKAASGIIGTFLGPRSPGTAYVLLHHYMGEIDGVFRAWGFAKGGNGSVSAAIAAAAREAGAEIRTGAPVARVLVSNGRARGVVLEDGEEIRARIVVSSADPRRTFVQLVGTCASARGVRPGDRALQVPRLFRQGQSRAVRASGFHVPSGQRPASARRDLDQPERRVPRARLRRCQVRRSSRADRTWTSSFRR